MGVEYTDKGKVFTKVVRKNVVRAHIQVSTHLIIGDVYLKRDTRIKDKLEFTEQFIAITDAEVYDLSGQLVYNVPFLTVNREQIIWLVPEKEEQA